MILILIYFISDNNFIKQNQLEGYKEQIIKPRKSIHFGFVRIDRVDEEARNNLFVLNSETPSPIIDIKTAALNDKRSFFTAEFPKSYL
jgi:hypothetical protein